MRKSMKKLIALTLACLMLATLFVGCGKKDDGKANNADAPAKGNVRAFAVTSAVTPRRSLKGQL